jgi:hypothetical protein
LVGDPAVSSRISPDLAASYGSLARFKDIQRLHVLGEQTVIGVAGDMSDFQYLKKELDAILYVKLLCHHASWRPTFFLQR